MPPVEMSRSMFTPAYQELVLLCAALLQAKQNPNGPLQLVNADSAALRSEVPALYELAARAFISSQKDWQRDAEDALDLCIEVVMRVCFGENWLPAGAMRGLQSREVKEVFEDKLLALAGGKTRRGVLPPGLLDLYLACLPIIYFNDEAGIKKLREKVGRARERVKPMVLPHPRPPVMRLMQSLLSWRQVSALIGSSLLLVWLVYFVGWHSAVAELRSILPGQPPAAVAPSHSSHQEHAIQEGHDVAAIAQGK